MHRGLNPDLSLRPSYSKSFSNRREHRGSLWEISAYRPLHAINSTFRGTWRVRRNREASATRVNPSDGAEAPETAPHLWPFACHGISLWLQTARAGCETTRHAFAGGLEKIGPLVVCGCLAAACSAPVLAGGLEPGTLFSELQSQNDLYESQAARHKPSSQLPSSREAEAIMEFDRDLFTDDAWDGMKWIVEYAKYVERVQDLEEEPGCEQCSRNRELLERAWQTVANEFYDPRSSFSQAAWAEQLLKTLKEAGGTLRSKRETYAALRGMMASLGDPYTEFLRPDRFRFALRRPMPAERDYLAAQFTGTGLQVSKRSPHGGWVVDGILAESPAEEAGIRPGERITEIDYYATDKLAASEVTALLRGPSGSVVYLLLAGPEKGSPVREVDLERRSIPQPPVKSAVVQTAQGPVTYIRMHYFSSGATRGLAAALQRAEAHGHLGTIIDLRNNPGGVFEEAILAASFFLPPGAQIVETVRSDFLVDAVFQAGDLPRGIFPSEPGLLSRRPVAILLNSGSASASEVFAGALHDNRRAVLVGEKTFGKGIVQYFFPLGDGSGLKITVFKYLTPSGYDITTKGGLATDVFCNDFPHAGPPNPDSDACIALAVNRILSR